MKNQYLTEKRKIWYMEDFHNLLKIELDFWKIDNLILKNTLIEINKNPDIQTLYSKGFDKNNFHDKESYLTLAYTKKIELKLFRNIIPQLITNYNSEFYSYFDYDFFTPKENLNIDSPTFGTKCTSDKNYFKINHIKLNLKSSNYKIHDAFWEELRLKLADLKDV